MRDGARFIPEPASMGYDEANPARTFAIYSVGKKAINFEPMHRYIGVKLMSDPHEKESFNPDALWVFELA